MNFEPRIQVEREYLVLAQWLEALPDELRRLAGPHPYELGDSVLYRQLHDPSDMLARSAIAALGRVTEGYFERQEDRLPLAGAVLAEPRLLDLGLIVHAAALLPASRMPRHQGFYAATLLDRVLSDIDRGDVALRLVRLLLEAMEPALCARLRETAAPITRGFGPNADWPSPGEAAALADLLETLRPRWLDVAGVLHDAVQEHGIVPGSALLAWGRLPAAVDGQARALLEPINRPVQRENAETRLRAALGWPAWAHAIFTNLRGKTGWLRLHLAYLIRIAAGIGRLAGPPAPDQAFFLLDRAGEVFEQDLVYVMARGLDSFAGQTVELFSPRAPRATLVDIDLDARRQRLRRQRVACLDGALDVIEDDFMDLLADIAELCFERE